MWVSCLQHVLRRHQSGLRTPDRRFMKVGSLVAPERLEVTVCIPSLTGLRLNFTVSWGDLHYIGLTGLEVVGKDGEALPIQPQQLSASPRDLNDLPEYSDDSRTLDK